jgi:uncharacterized membrane protein YedE/YeeE
MSLLILAAGFIAGVMFVFAVDWWLDRSARKRTLMYSTPHDYEETKK